MDLCSNYRLHVILHNVLVCVCKVLTVQSQYWWGEWRWVGECELDSVLFRPLQQVWGLVTLLLLTSLLLAFLLLPSQGLLSLLLLRGNKTEESTGNSQVVDRKF